MWFPGLVQLRLSATQKLWGLGPSARGYIIEAFLCPQYGEAHRYGFKTFDCFVQLVSGEIVEMTNIKSINLHDITYQDPVRLRARLKTILTSTQESNGSGTRILVAGGVKRIVIAIPPGPISADVQPVLDEFAAKQTLTLLIEFRTAAF
jgi:hypothetical protein